MTKSRIRELTDMIAILAHDISNLEQMINCENSIISVVLKTGYRTFNADLKKKKSTQFLIFRVLSFEKQAKEQLKINFLHELKAIESEGIVQELRFFSDMEKSLHQPSIRIAHGIEQQKYNDAVDALGKVLLPDRIDQDENFNSSTWHNIKTDVTQEDAEMVAVLYNWTKGLGRTSPRTNLIVDRLNKLISTAYSQVFNDPSDWKPVLESGILKVVNRD